jgi:hypothetical protein
MSIQNTAQSVVFPINKASAEQITEYLKAALQTVRVAYLNVGRLLNQMREGKSKTRI